ncbi:MAG: c-type cytochrome, partial [Myxococcota bacterium]|nr:c-type cytochrome [Myxococcota bacterium]
SSADAFGRGFEGDFAGGAFEPAVAWRTISAPAGEIAMVHQRASGQEVAPDPGGYGGGSGCESSIVQSSLTFFHEDGTITGGPDLARATLPVDVAISPVLADGSQRVAVVAAGNERGESSVLVYQRLNLEHSFPGDCMFPEQETSSPIPNATSAAYAQDGTLVVLSRDATSGATGANLALIGQFGDVSWIPLGGEARFDAGHAVFHGNSGAFLACASCHPEGGEDGRTWTFGRIGGRRTPAMHGDLIGTEPFHWDGDMQDLEHLVRDVFTGRMQGPALGPAQIDALGGWLDALPAPTSSPVVDADAVARGATLFNGEAQCATCHSGALYSSNATVDVGTGGAFQVPSLIGVSYRTPVMHSGCATTLHERFSDACGGGDMHGRTSHLAPEQVDDLVAFLDTI